MFDGGRRGKSKGCRATLSYFYALVVNRVGTRGLVKHLKCKWAGSCWGLKESAEGKGGEVRGAEGEENLLGEGGGETQR